LFSSSDGKLIRGLSGPAAHGFELARSSGWLKREIDKGHVVAYAEVPRGNGDGDAQEMAARFSRLVAHPRIAPVTYPFEWTFTALKRAALLHLDLQLSAFDAGLAFRDASAYNVLFAGTAPVFVDLGSFAPYTEGEHWMGLSQFCREFLNPLLLEAHLGLPFQAWYRGSPGGIPSDQLSRVLPARTWLSPRLLALVHLQAHYQRRRDLRTLNRAENTQQHKQLSRPGYRAIIEDMRGLVEGLTSRRRGSLWKDYERSKSYSDEEAHIKAREVALFVTRNSPAMLVDLGCNTGVFSRVAADAGAGAVVGIEADPDALDEAFCEAAAANRRFTALNSDLADPSPGGGWMLEERVALWPRIRADACLALALVHHLVLGRNLLLDEVLATVCDVAPRGLLEFIPCDDPMAQSLVALRRGETRTYTEAEFTSQLSRCARIVSIFDVSKTGRKLIEYERLRP
jgi:ribosomal protein L11 methylase PrmA